MMSYKVTNDLQFDLFSVELASFEDDPECNNFDHEIIKHDEL